MYNIQKISFSPKQPSVYFYKDFGRKWLLFPSLNIFDAFELDVNVVNFVYLWENSTEGPTVSGRHRKKFSIIFSHASLVLVEFSWFV